MSEQTIAVKIDVTKIEKARLFNGAKGVYLDALLVPKRSDYGDDFMIVQSVKKEEREQGIKGPIIGNAKFLQRREQPRPAAKPSPSQESPMDDVPFN
jgi:hypothetical protein